MYGHEYYMTLALQEAQKAGEDGEVPVGAILVREGKIIARDHNRPIALADPTAHAEILVLRAGAYKLRNYRLSGCTLYVTIEPCAMCAGAILQARISRLVFGAPDQKGGAVVSLFQLLNDKRLNHQVEIVPGVLQKECAEILSHFFADRRR
ncbi:MAG: tRNA adenosine(34) deaminase TadA [Thermodesulfobacteriota bacterium]